MAQPEQAQTNTAWPAILAEREWQMTFGERAALEGLLAAARPQLAIEIGTAEGGSLARIAQHSQEVHSFDLVEPRPAAKALANVEFHTGDNHLLLPQLLERFAAAGRNVDFVLVDGDHSFAGVRQDLVDLLDSPAIGNTLIVMHDTINPEVRGGLEAADALSHAKVRYLDFDFVAGELSRAPNYYNQLWGGLGLIHVDAGGEAPPARQNRNFEAFDLLRTALAVKLASGDPSGEELVGAADELAARAAFAEGELQQVRGSLSWRITRPLRRAKSKLVRHRSNS